MRIQVQTYRRQQISRATIYHKEHRWAWEARHVRHYELDRASQEFLDSWPNVPAPRGLRSRERR